MTIGNVPIVKIGDAGYCLSAAAYMVVKYWQDKTRFSSSLPSYDQFREVFPRSDVSLGTPPGKIRDYFRRLEQIQKVRVRHLDGHDLSTLELRVREKQPPIALLDLLYYHQRSPLSRSSHATVIVGYTTETLLANNPVYGPEYPYEKKRFREAWQRRGMKYILITPRESLTSYMGTS